MDDFAPRYALNDARPTRELALEIALDPATSLLVDAEDYPVGVFWLDEVTDLHAEAHWLVRPEYYRAMVKAGLHKTIVDRAFEVSGLPKLKCYIADAHTGIAKLLKRTQWRVVGVWTKEARLSGKVVSVVLFELHRKYWRKFRKGK